MAPRKTSTTAKKAPAAAKKPSAPRKGPKTIRNLRGTVVHARLYSQNQKDPFRIALNPRGQQGDTAVIPVALQDDGTYIQGVGVLWEVITQTEAKAIQYSPVGYLGREDAPTIIRPEDTTVATADDWDGTGRRIPQDRNVQRKERGSEQTHADREFGTGMHTADVPGADHGLHAQLKAAQTAAEAMGQEATPEGVDVTSRKVVVERVKGQ